MLNCIIKVTCKFTQMKKAIVLIILISSSFILASCKKDKDSSGGGPDVTPLDCGTVRFSTTILPLINAKCATSGCHAAGSSSGPGALTNYSQIFTNRTQVINAVNANRMPPGGPLSTTEKLQLACWIDAGAPNN